LPNEQQTTPKKVLALSSNVEVKHQMIFCLTMNHQPTELLFTLEYYHVKNLPKGLTKVLKHKT